MKDRYYAQLAEYKKTQDYAHYQNYLEEFKAKHEPSSKYPILLQAGEHGLILSIDGKRLKEDKNASPGRRSSDERLVSSPDHTENCASSIEQYGSIRRPSAIGSPQIVNTADWRPLTLSNHTSPDISTPDSNRSPRHNQPAFSSINAPQSNTPALMNHRRTNTHSGGRISNEQPPPYGHQHEHGVRLPPYARHPKFVVLVQLATTRPLSQTHIGQRKLTTFAPALRLAQL